MLRTALLGVTLLLGSAVALAQGPPAPGGASPVSGARAKPTAAEKRCLASRRRVERQLEVIAQADARIAKERIARESCKTRRACENLDRALNASKTRDQRHAKQLAQLESEALKACAAVSDGSNGPSYRSSTAVTSSPTTTNANSTK